jgi:hypothetical protein
MCQSLAEEQQREQDYASQQDDQRYTQDYPAAAARRLG